MRIFTVANNLQPVRKILKRLSKSPFLTYFGHILNGFFSLVVFQKDHTRESKIELRSEF